MSTQTRSGGGGGGGGGNSRSQKKSNSANAGGGTGHDAAPHSAANKKGDANKTDKPEKAQPKATTEQLRIAQITNSTTEDPQINEKVTLLLTMTQRSEEEVCCALNECDYDLEAAANFLIEELPQGAFAKYEKKRKRPASTTADGAAGEGEWADGNANADKRENTRNRSSNRGGGRGGTDSRGWRGRETRENERNTRESRGGGGERGGERGDDRANENYRGQRNGGRSAPGGGGGRGGGFVSRSGRGGGRMGGRSSGPRGDRASGSGGFGAGRSSNANEDHHEVELWDNTIAQNAEKQQPGHDDAWGDWNNEEYEGSLKDSKVFTTSNLSTQTAANVVSGGGAGTGAASGTGSGGELSAPPGLEHHLGSSALAQQGSHLGALVSSVAVGTSGEDNSGSSGPPATPPSALSGSATTPLLQYSAAVSNPPPQMQSQGTQHSSGGGTAAGGGGSASSSFVSAASDTFTSAASAAATLVQQAQQQQQLQQQQTTPIKPSATLSVEQSQYFNSLASQGVSPGSTAVQPTPTGYAPSSTTAYSQTSTSGGVGVGVSVGGSQYPSTYANVFGSAAGDQSQQQTQQDDYQNKSQQQQQQSTLTAGLQSSQIGDALSAAGYAARSTAQQQQQSGSSAVASNALDQLTKNDPYGQASSAGNAYQNAYQSSTASKANSAYQTQGGYGGSSYANVQSSVANSYQPQSYGSYQPNVNSYQQQQQTVAGAQSSAGGVPGSGQAATQNIPVGGSASQNSSSGNASSAYLTSGYSTPQSAYQSSQSVYGNSSGFAGSASNASSQYASFSASAKLKDASTASGATHYDSVSTSSGVSSSSGSTGNGAAGVVSGQPGVNQASVSNNNNVSGSNSNSNVTAGVTSGNVAGGGVSQSGVSSGGVGVAGVSGSASSVGVNMNNNNAGSVGGAAAAAQTAAGTAAVLASLTNKNSSSSNSSGSGGGGGATTAGGASTGSGGGGAGSGAGSGGGGGSGSGLVPTNIQMVSQYIQTGLPYYQQPVYSYEELQMMQQRVPHVQGYYDLNYTPTSLGAGRDNLGSVAYSTMTDGRFARTDNNSSPVSNVSSTMSQQAGSSAPMLNVPYAYFYGGNVMPGGFQYGTPAIYPQQIPTANTASGGQFPKPSYSAGYGSTNYDTLSQTTQDYSKGGYSSSVNQQTKTQTVSNQPQAGTASDLTSSMYGKGHVALNKVNSYEKQSFHSGTPPPFNMANTQTAGGTSAQPYGMYLPMPAAGHHNMIHQPIHQMDGRIHSSSRRDSNSAGPRQQSSSQSKSAGKQGYSPSYWTGQN
ncbi:protein lingerer isoform X8 [Drosophila subobscura]|uniref:protein lingerer isoform X8 n=1 Tax=Drosophila subobscura TaxID=7241 RepID=UPI00155B19AC|nr:protein lingerer isoform X8 [Drosophila subobscura]